MATTVNRFNRAIYTKGTAKYSDFDMAFRANPMTGDIALKTDLDAIKQSINNLIHTHAGERPFQPAIAGNLGQLLFEPLDPITTKQLEFSLKAVISNFEPRVSVNSITVNPNYDQLELKLTINVDIVNIPGNQTINILLKRTR